MFALVRTRECPAESPLKRLARRLSAADGLHFELSSSFGVRVLECTIDILQNESKRRSHARADRAFNFLAENKIICVVPSENFEFSELIQQYKLYIPDLKKLWSKTAGMIASYIMELGNDATSVAIYANRVSSELDDTVKHLLPLTRRLALCCSGRAELYIRALLREYGISIVTSYRALVSADIHLMLQRPPVLPEVKSNAVAIQFYSDEYKLPCYSVKNIEYSWPERIMLPQGYPADMLLAALNEAGAIRPQEINIKNVLISENDTV